MAMQKIVDEYNATNPAYTVEHLMVEQGDLYAKLPMAINTDQGVPDLVIQHVDRMPANARARLWRSIRSCSEFVFRSGRSSHF